MSYNANRAAMIKDGKVLYWITKDGDDLISYDNFLSAVMSLSNYQKDKTAKYDMVVRSKPEYAAEWDLSPSAPRIKPHS